MLETNFKGSTKTQEMVRRQIDIRFGKDTQYDPRTNCRTYMDWQRNGYQVKQGEKAIKSYTFYVIKKPDGDVKIRKSINLFYQTQVQKI